MSSTEDKFLNLISDPFRTQIQANSFYASIGWSFTGSVCLFGTFCLLRPRIPTIYARRAKYSDDKHAPPPLETTPFSWFRSVRGYDEQELTEKIGLDAVVFLRFIRMLRNIFVMLAVFGISVLIPVNVVGGHGVYKNWSNVANLMKLTPLYIFGPKLWAFVAMAYILQAVVFFFLWRNYRAVLRLRVAYFNSRDYQSSMHARTLLVTHIPQDARTDSGIAQLVERAKSLRDRPSTFIARSIKGLPVLVEEHDETVRKLESCLASYLRNSKRRTARRPTMRPFKQDRGLYQEDKVDAIVYLVTRMHRLQAEIDALRQGVDNREAQPYGFASYSQIGDAHAVAYAARKTGPGGTTIRLAPKPHDLIWQNLAMSRSARKARKGWNISVMLMLTVAYIPINIVTAVFLSDFSHVGLLWEGFQKNLEAHPAAWGIAQGIVAPAVQITVFFFLPSIFRRLYTRSGDVSKTSRERHVCSRLYGFVVFNNLVVFSTFGSVFKVLAEIKSAQKDDLKSAISHAHPFASFMSGLCSVSTFWLTYQVQQSLSAAVDLAQIVSLAQSFCRRRLGSWGWWPLTPRETITLSAPQPLDYASYYNTYLFLTTVGLCFGTLQPIILLMTAIYLMLEVFFKRYLVQYVLFTKTESGGAFWRMLVNRLLFAVLLANAVVALVVGAQGVGAHDVIQDAASNGAMLYAMLPLPILVWAFKLYLRRTFDDRMRYFSTKAPPELDGAQTEAAVLGQKSTKNEKVASRFGHPVLHRKLLTPMVAPEGQHLLQEIHSGLRPGSAEQKDIIQHEYGDVYMSELDPVRPGHKPLEGQESGSEVVPESELDFAYFQRRAEFADEFGGEGELYGRSDDAMPPHTLSRSGTASTHATLGDQPLWRKPLAAAVVPSTRESSRTRIEGCGSDSEADGPTAVESSRTLPQLYNYRRPHDIQGSLDMDDLPSPSVEPNDIMAMGHGEYPDADAGGLLRDAQRPGTSSTASHRTYEP